MVSASSRAVLSIAAPVDRGPLLTPEQVARMLGAHEAQVSRTKKIKGKRRRVVVTDLVEPTPAWVRRVVPGKLTLGRKTIRWRERDVLNWLEERRAS